MMRTVSFLLLFLLLAQFLSSGTSSRPGKKKEKELEHVNYVPEDHHHHHQQASRQLSTTNRDITTPITTVPNLVPTTPTSPTPILNPNSNPDVTVSPANTIPITSTNSPPSSSSSSLGSSWCVATPAASQTALQVALDYACGFGGADCTAIQPGGRCYNPNSVRNHASYAFNNYYQKNPVPNSCNFGGTAVITSTNPSTGTCEFPSTSTSSSILNTTNSVGANVFGSVPVPSSCQALTSNNGFSQIQLITLWLLTSVLAAKFL
ncbi:PLASMODESMATA CALLOSE-BINDING PROTEIN 5-like [Prosopis cineraria]|uniref:PLASMODESMATA CALLOSE-BINDING PROTEIN 5-like n=1 Tax=Prosopis cineraria TaxID=364024 RepID=UPI00240EF60F|nr:PLASMODESMATA CALLOSE-BINDING PROTEIN 5-like [Prosopis cineraria]